MRTTGDNGDAPADGTSGGSAKTSTLHRLYTGTGAFDIVGKRKYWYLILGLLMAVCVGSIGLKGFNLSIEFEGGTNISMPAQSAGGPITDEKARGAFRKTMGYAPDSVQLVGSGDTQTVQINTDKLGVEELTKAKSGLFERLQPLGANGQPTPNAVSDSAVSGTWGSEITRQALIALAVFLVLVTVFLAFYFERWMAVGALVALFHDVVVTAGVYSLVGFEVSPSTVIGLLTILGFSLYDTVVVFDKVKENTAGLLTLTRRTYPEAANLAVNQTLMRSINTSVIALLPVLGLLFVGAGLLGVGVLRDLALVQGVGMVAGVLSSILLATPLLVDLKMRESKYKAQAAKVMQRRQNRQRPAEATAGADAEESTAGTDEADSGNRSGDAREMVGAGSARSESTTSDRSRRSAGNSPSGKSSSSKSPSGKTQSNKAQSNRAPSGKSGRKSTGRKRH